MPASAPSSSRFTTPSTDGDDLNIDDTISHQILSMLRDVSFVSRNQSCPVLHATQIYPDSDTTPGIVDSVPDTYFDNVSVNTFYEVFA